MIGQREGSGKTLATMRLALMSTRCPLHGEKVKMADTDAICFECDCVLTIGSPLFDMKKLREMDEALADRLGGTPAEKLVISSFYGEIRRLDRAKERQVKREMNPFASDIMNPTEFKVGDMAEKTAGDYYFRGTVVAVFTKKSGAVRLVIENADGILHIFNPTCFTISRNDIMNLFARAWKRSEAWGTAWACGSFQYEQEWEAKYGRTWRRWFHNPKNIMDSVYSGIRFSIAIYPIALIREVYLSFKEN